MTQKRKNDAESAELKTQNHYNAAASHPSRKIRIYRARDHTGILAAVEDPEGKCYIGYFSTVKRKIRRADPRRDQNQKEPLTKQNPTCASWNEVQERLDQYAKEMKLRELPLTIGGEIEEDKT